MDLDACYAGTVDAARRAFAAALNDDDDASERDEQMVLAALLEDPVGMIGGRPNLANRYQEIPVVWKRCGEASSSAAGDMMAGAIHEISQTFVRPLSFGRRLCFRIHRFVPAISPQGDSIVQALSNLALDRAQEAAAAASARADECGAEAGSRKNSLPGSNIGGYQEVLGSSEPLAGALQAAFLHCVSSASEVDAAAIMLAAGDDDTPPSSPRKDGTFASWMNVSFKGSLNQLHNHGTSAWAAVAYTQVPKPSMSDDNNRNINTESNDQHTGVVNSNGDGHVGGGLKPGSLLLCLKRGHGLKFMEPDEELHVSRMWHPGDGQDNDDEVEDAVETEGCDDGDTAGRYLQLQPKQGTIIVFPGWLPHSVTPHFQEEPRVCYASNWS